MQLKTTKLKLLIQIFALACITNVSLQAQITANTVVMPPYSPFVEDYANSTQITVTAFDFGTIDCNLRISIIGDNGIELTSKRDVSYSYFTLYNGIPLILSGLDLQEYFQLQNLIISGISQSELQSNGLPAGNYQICAVVYFDGEPRSPESPSGCSNIFTIADLSVNVTTQVIPPFYTDITEYANTTLVTLLANRSANVSLKISISGDNGVELSTRTGFIPGNLISLSVTPLMLTAVDLNEYFQPNSLSVSGISPDELFNYGLPEGTYKLCVSVYENNSLVSQEGVVGCSNYFTINYLEPPMLISPADLSEIENTTIQNIVFSWTPSPGAPPWTKYTLKIVEILDPAQNPNDAMLSATTPAFFEEEVQGTAFLYSPAQPLLEPGNRYAFQVIASDDESNRRFQNFGKSEVSSFTFGNSANNLFSFASDDSVATNTSYGASFEKFKDEFKFIPTTTISGRLLAKFPDNPNSGVIYNNSVYDEPLVTNPESQNVDLNLPQSSSNATIVTSKGGNANNKSGVSYSEVTKVSSSITSNSGSNNTSQGGSAVVSSNNITTGMVTMAARQPYYYYGKTEELVNTKPLANVKIRLVARFAAHTTGNQLINSSTEYSDPEYRDPQLNELVMGINDLNGNIRNHNDILNVVLATATTEESGDFTFNFNTDFFTGNAAITSMGPGHIEEDLYEVNPLDKLEWGMDEIFPGVDMDVIGNILNQQNNYSSQNQFTSNQQSISGITQQTVIQSNQQALGQAGQQHTGGQTPMSYTPGEESHYSGYICLKIEVINPKFCSPDIDIFAMPGDVLDVPTQVAKLKTYNLKVVAKASDVRNQTATADEPMDNVRVHLLRKKQDVDNELSLIIDYEGQKLKTETHINNGVFKDVAIDTSGADPYAFVYFKNLVKHAQFNPQYLIELSTRNIADVEDEYEFTRYNYETQFKALETTNENDASYLSNEAYSGRHVVYNREFEIPEIEFIDTLKPLNPEIKGRIMAKTNFQNTSVEKVRVELYDQNKLNQTYTSAGQFAAATIGSSVSFETDTKSNEVGIFNFENLNITTNANDDVVGPYRRILISHPSYKTVTRPIPGFKPYNLSLGMLKDIKDINLEPADSIYGYICDEDGNPVSAYVKTAYSPFYVSYPYHYINKQYQFFSLPAQHHYNVITVHPKSSQYFKRDTIINILPNKRFKIVVYKKLHRPKIKIVSPLGVPIQGVVVELGEQAPVNTNNQGYAQFKYASPDNQTIIRISPPSNFAPVQEPIDIPPTATDTVITYILEYAKAIQGTVTEKDNGTVVNAALIYAELENTDGTILYIEATSNQQGNYTLTGIPKSIKSLKVYAVKKGNNPSYVGTYKTITLPESLTTTECNFELRRMDDWDLSSIWGYPVAISGFRPVKNKTDEYLIDGYFYNPPLTEGFTLQQPDIKLDFKYLRIKKSASSKIEPFESNIVLDVNQIPLFVNEIFSGILYNKQVSTGKGHGLSYLGCHEIIKDGNKANLHGHLKLNLSTFNIAYDFNGELYAGSSELGNKVEVFSKTQATNQAQIITEVQAQYQAQIQTQQAQYINNLLPRLNIFSLNGSLQPIPITNYQIFKFPASSKNEGSYLAGDKIWIQTILHTDIPRCKTCSNLDLEILAGNVVITKNDIELVELPYDTLNFQLEQWKVYNKGNWYFDKNEETIVLEKALIVTGKSVNATVKNLKIRPTSLGEGEIDMSNGGLSLGGIAKITLNGNLKPLFNYDPIGHYRISLVGSIDMDVPAGTVEQLPAMSQGDRIEFESIGMLSNGTDIFTINKNFRFYSILDMEVSQIVSGNGYFDLQGMPILGIPDLIPQETAMRYKLNTQGDIIAELQPIKGGINTNGNVYFSFDQESLAHSIKNKEYTGYGTLFISPGADPKDSRTFTLRGQLIKTPGQCKIDVFPVDQNGYRGSTLQEMVVGNKKILITDGILTSSHNNWDSLVYTGITPSFEGLNDPTKPQNKLTFVVHGAIGVTSSDIQVKNIDTGIGKLKMLYNFDDASMKGTLEMKNVPLGPAFINQGEMTVNFDKNGFYFVVASESLIIGTAGQFKGGFILGSTNKVYGEDISCLSDNFKIDLPDFTGQGLTGMYVIGEKVVANKTIDLIFLEASAKAGLGLFVNTNFSSNPTFIIGGYGHASIEGSAGFEELGVTVCNVWACLSAYYKVEAGYESGSIIMDNCASISAAGGSSGVCTAPLEAIGVDPSLSYSISAKYGYSSSKGFYTQLDLGGSCTSGNNSNNSDICK
jgi:hypothetical protein